MDLYRQLENRFDGFITTGPVPMQTIRKSVPDCKPLSFFLCSDSNYYKMLFEVIYKYQDWNFEYWYFDFCDYLCPDQESSLVEYLKNGTFGEWLEKNNRYMEDMSVEDMMESTKRKLEKHIRLWNSGKIKYSLSRMSPIMPQILEAGVNCYYINFSKEYIRETGGFDVCVGYGMGADLPQAETAAAAAARESRISTDQASYLLNTRSERIRLSGRGHDFTVSDAVTPYIRELSDRSGLSTLTIQKLAAALKITGTEEVTPQDLARILHITVRSANRFVASLVSSNLACALYSKQTNTKGRPSKVYKILIDMDKINEAK